MKKYTEHCDLCEEELTNKNGFCIEIGYSKGGWGKRRDLVSKETIEVCLDCFKPLEKKQMNLMN